MSENTKKFRIFDAVLAAVCIILVVESVAPAAAIGNSQFFWWIFILIGFFLPYGLISAELGTTYEGEGGIYDWVKRAYGEKWGSRIAWYYYINFALWVGSLAVLFTDVITQISGVQFNTFTAIIIQLAFIWAVVGISCFKVSDSKWILNIAALFKAIIMLTIGGLGIYVAVTKGTANEFTPQSLMPSLNVTSLSNISVIIFNFLGFEVVTTFASEMKNPGKEIPQAIILGGIFIAAFYLLAAFGIGVAIPVEELSLSSGLLESLMFLSGQTSGPLIVIFGLMFLYTIMSNLISWSLGVNFVVRYAARQNSLPSPFAKSSKKNDMPIGANIANGIVATLMVLAAPIIPSPDIFWSFFALNMVMLLVSYVVMFPAFLKLRDIDPDIERPFKVKGGRTKLLWMTYLPMVLLLISIIFSIVPLNMSQEELSSKIPLLIGTILTIIIGEIIAYQSVMKNKRLNNIQQEE